MTEVNCLWRHSNITLSRFSSLSPALCLLLPFFLFPLLLSLPFYPILFLSFLSSIFSISSSFFCLSPSSTSSSPPLNRVSSSFEPPSFLLFSPLPSSIRRLFPFLVFLLFVLLGV